MNARRCVVLTTAVLAAVNVARAVGVLGPPVVSAAVLSAGVALVAWSCGATRGDLGLRRADVPAGVRYGLAALGVVLLVLLVAAALPATNGFLHDSRADVSGGRLLGDLAVAILLVTVLPEEFAFRGVLLGAAVELWGPVRGTLVTSALFGLWHIAPTLDTMSGNRVAGEAAGSVVGQVLVVTGAVAATFAAGVIFAWLRLHSKSLVAPAIAHQATNGVALAVAWVVTR